MAHTTSVAHGGPPAARIGTYIGLFLVTSSTLMLEIALTRIFSVTMWYHFAFVAISVALFGMTAGALIVHLFPRRFPEAEPLSFSAHTVPGLNDDDMLAFDAMLDLPGSSSLVTEPLGDRRWRPTGGRGGRDERKSGL